MSVFRLFVWIGQRTFPGGQVAFFTVCPGTVLLEWLFSTSQETCGCRWKTLRDKGAEAVLRAADDASAAATVMRTVDSVRMTLPGAVSPLFSGFDPYHYRVREFESSFLKWGMGEVEQAARGLWYLHPGTGLRAGLLDPKPVLLATGAHQTTVLVFKVVPGLNFGTKKQSSFKGRAILFKISSLALVFHRELGVALLAENSGPVSPACELAGSLLQLPKGDRSSSFVSLCVGIERYSFLEELISLFAFSPQAMRKLVVLYFFFYCYPYRFNLFNDTKTEKTRTQDRHQSRLACSLESCWCLYKVCWSHWLSW